MNDDQLLVEITLRTCTRRFAVAPCMASGPAGTECFNTRASCQDPPNFQAESVNRLRLCRRQARPEPGHLPCIVQVREQSQKLNPNGTPRWNNAVTVTLTDFVLPDRPADDYYSRRIETGGYLSRLIARHPYLVNNAARITYGGRTTHWIVSSVSPPDAGRQITIILHDPLRRALEQQLPVGSEAALASAVTTETTLAINGVDGPGVEAGRYAVIDEEIVLISQVNAGTNTIQVARAQLGTARGDHSADATVQPIYRLASVNLVDAIRQTLIDSGGVSAARLPAAVWDAEKAAGFTAHTLNDVLVVRPKRVGEVLDQLCALGPLALAWDAAEQIIRPIGQTQFQSIGEPLDYRKILADKDIRIRQRPDLHMTRCVLHYNRARPSDDSELISTVARVDAEGEGQERWGRAYIYEKKLPIANFLDRPLVRLASARLQQRWGNINAMPLEVQCEISRTHRDAFRLGTVMDLCLPRQIQTKYGLIGLLRGQVVQATEDYVTGNIKLTILSYLPANTNLVDVTPTPPDEGGGDPNDITHRIDGGATTRDVFFAIGAPPQPVNLRVIVNSHVRSDDVGQAALLFRNFHPESTLRLEVTANGLITGMGGRGGGFAPAESGESNLEILPEKGGAAIISHLPLTIENAGLIAGGGGGGYNQRSVAQVSAPNINRHVVYSSGGSGAGGFPAGRWQDGLDLAGYFNYGTGTAGYIAQHSGGDNESSFSLDVLESRENEAGGDAPDFAPGRASFIRFRFGSGGIFQREASRGYELGIWLPSRFNFAGPQPTDAIITRSGATAMVSNTGSGEIRGAVTEE